MINVDVFKDASIDEDEQKRTLQNPTSSRKGNLMVKGVVSFRKLDDLRTVSGYLLMLKPIVP